MVAGLDGLDHTQPELAVGRGHLAIDDAVDEVRAFDRWRGETSARTTYKLQDAVP